MKILYINSRLHPLLIAPRPRHKNRTWLWTRGEPWLLLTPGRLERLAVRLGLTDDRVDSLFGLVRRHSPCPELYCRRLGVPEVGHVPPEAYPKTFCPRCNGILAAHPEDTGALCPYCAREKERSDNAVAGGRQADIREDHGARLRVLSKDSFALTEQVLGPNPKYNQHRVVERDWNQAVQRILRGATYRGLAREMRCSVGLLHKKVMERRWECN